MANANPNSDILVTSVKLSFTGSTDKKAQMPMVRSSVKRYETVGQWTQKTVETNPQWMYNAVRKQLHDDGAVFINYGDGWETLILINDSEFPKSLNDTASVGIGSFIVHKDDEEAKDDVYGVLLPDNCLWDHLKCESENKTVFVKTTGSPWLSCVDIDAASDYKKRVLRMWIKKHKVTRLGHSATLDGQLLNLLKGVPSTSGTGVVNGVSDSKLPASDEVPQKRTAKKTTVKKKAKKDADEKDAGEKKPSTPTKPKPPAKKTQAKSETKTSGAKKGTKQEAKKETTGELFNAREVIILHKALIESLTAADLALNCSKSSKADIKKASVLVKEANDEARQLYSDELSSDEAEDEQDKPRPKPMKKADSTEKKKTAVSKKATAGKRKRDESPPRSPKNGSASKKQDVKLTPKVSRAKGSKNKTKKAAD